MAEGNIVSTSLVPVDRPKSDSAKSRFSDGGDFAKVLNQSGLLKPLKDMMRNVSSIADFVKAQNKFNEWSKEENSDTNGETLPKETVVGIASDIKQLVSAVTANLNVQPQDLTMDAIRYDLQSWFKEMKWKNKKEDKWRTAVHDTLESMQKSGLLKTLFLLVTVGVVALITKVGLAVKSFFVLASGITKALRVIERIPLIGKAVTPIAEMFGFATGKLGTLSKMFELLPGKFLTKLAPIFKFFGMGARFMKAIPVLGWVITGIMALVDGVKGFLNADAITGKIADFGDKMVAALSSILSGFTLGLIDTKTIAKVIEPLNILFNSLKEQFDSYINVIDSVVGYFKGTKSMDDVVDSLGGYIKTMFMTSIKIAFISLPKTAVSVILWALKTSLVSIPKFVIDFMASVTKKIFGEGVLYKALTNLSDKFSKIGSIFDSVGTKVDKFFEFVKTLPNKIYLAMVSLFDLIGYAIDKFVKFVKTLPRIISSIVVKIKNSFVGIWKSITGVLSEVVGKLKSVLVGVIDMVISVFAELPAKLLDSVKNVVSVIASVFSGIPSMLMNEMKSVSRSVPGAAWLLEKVSSVIAGNHSSANDIKLEQEETQTDNGKEMSEVVVPTEKKDNKEAVDAMKEQSDLLQKMVNINEQMYNRMMPQTVVAFN